MIPDREIPGYLEAVAKESYQRDIAFNADAPEIICGIPVKPMCLRHLQCLRAAGSPFFHGLNPTPEDCAIFLWIVSHEFRPILGWLDRRAQRRFIARLRNLEFGKLIESIREYISDAFSDSPPDSGFSNGKSYWSLSASFVDMFRREYQWDAHYIMEQPLKVLFQLQNIIRKRNHSSASLFNRSDKIAREYRRKIREASSGIL